MAYDLKITGGTIVDGTRRPRLQGDLGIKDGKVVAIGTAPEEANRTIDASGRVVCPGFVDIHTHYDAQIIWDQLVSCSPWHGVTTVVMGNCGFSVAPTRPSHRDLIMRTLENVEGMSVTALQAGLGDEWPFETFPEYLDAIEARGCAVNTTALIGHTALRLYVMGEDAVQRPATPEEVLQQRRIVAEAIEAGALGFATSKAVTHVGYDGHPVPSRLADFEEILEIAGALGEAGLGVMQCTLGRGLSHKEFARLAEATGRPVSWTALLSGQPGQDFHDELRKVAETADRGLPVYPQVAVQPVQFEMSWKAPFIYEALRCFAPISKAPDFDTKKAVYADPEWREEFKAKAGIGGKIGDRWERTDISWYPKDTSLEGRNVAELASAAGRDPVDVVLDLALDADLDMRIIQDVINYDRDSIEELLKDPNTMIGLSDAGAHASQLCDAKYSTEFLATFVRERKTFELEDAVHMLTQRPAQIFGVTDRGTLEEGKPADVVVFDPAEVGHLGKRRVFDLPGGADRLISDAKGIDAVVVNGTVIREGNRDTVSPGPGLPGKLLRNGKG
jgi:N-acyl-D-amino-acid deacylase